MYIIKEKLILARTSLKCRECNKEYETAFKYICDECFGPLDVKYDFPQLQKTHFLIVNKPIGDILNYFQ